MGMLATAIRNDRSCEDCRVEGCTLFGTLQHDASWAYYLRARTLHRFRARQTVFHEGTPAPLVHFLCKGQVKLSIAGRLRVSRIVRLVSAARTPCEILDKAGFGAHAHGVTCETLTDCQVCCLSKADFARLLSDEPAFAARVLSAVSAEAGALIESLREATAGQLRARLAKMLTKLADQHGVRTARGIDLDFSLSRREWAEILGTSRETVARLLNELHREEVLALSGRRITILAFDRLNRMSV
jgi:CRP/FNR family transcriptional regulator